MSQSYDLHRALLRPSIIFILRAAGFHSTKPSVLDTLTNIAERYLLLLASTTAQHAASAHNDAVPTITDIRMALTDCGVLVPHLNADEEFWTEMTRRPIDAIETSLAATDAHAAQTRAHATKRKRDAEDLEDVRMLTSWFDGHEHHEIKRVAGLIPDPTTSGNMPTVGVGGSVIQAEDFLTTLKRKYHGSKAVGVVDENARFVGTVLGRETDAEEREEVVIEGGPVGSIRAWMPKWDDRPKKKKIAVATMASQNGVSGSDDESDLSSIDADAVAS